MALWEPHGGAPLDIISNARASVFRAKFFIASQFASAVVGRMQNLCTFCPENAPLIWQNLSLLADYVRNRNKRKIRIRHVARALLTLLCNDD